MKFEHSAATAVLAVALSLSACARNVEVMSAPNLNVYTSYADKMPGKWALFVQASSLRRDVHTDGFQCAAYNYPLNLESSFKESVAATFRNLVTEVNLVNQAPTVASLANDGYAGLIRVNGDDLRAHLTIKPGFFSATAEVTVEIDAGVIVEGRTGRLLGTQASGTGRADHDAGAFCSGTGATISEASQSAMKASLGQLAERFSNSPQVRSGSTLSARAE